MFDVQLCQHLDEVAPPLTLEEIRNRVPDNTSLRMLSGTTGVEAPREAESTAVTPLSMARRGWVLVGATCVAAALVIVLVLANFGFGEQITETNTDLADVPERTPSTATTPEPAQSSVAARVAVSIAAGLTVEQTLVQISNQYPQISVDELQGVIEEGVLESDLLPGDRAAIEQADGFRTIYEGLLSPGSYELERGMSAADLLQVFVTNTERQLELARFDVGAEAHELSSYEVLVVASLVESEAIIDADRPRIARVIYNRLNEGLALGADNTAAYAAQKEADDLTADDLASTSPFNTRSLSSLGLPPTPISAPSAASLRAALAPADGSWMFYVRTDEGGVRGAFTFAATEREFQDAVETCRERNLGC